MTLRDVAQRARRGEVRNRVAGLFGKNVVRDGHQRVLLDEHRAVLRDERQPVDVRVDDDAQVGFLAHDDLRDFREVLRQRFGVVGEFARGFAVQLHDLAAQFAQQFRHHDAAHRVHGVDDDLKTAFAHRFDVDQRQRQHAADMLVVEILARQHMADGVDCGVVVILLLGHGQHLLALGVVEKLAVGVQQFHAQSGVKAMFNNKELAKAMNAKGYQFSSANSINIGRLVPQVVYYVYSYTRLLAQGVVKEGEQVNFVVPTGNFGNILAAFYAKNMGVPVGKLICASNDNKVLYDFFETGVYDKNREFILTTSPSMDILISSNLERLIYKIAGEDAKATADMMAALAKDGKYSITDAMKEQMKDFIGGWASEEKTASEIKRVYEKTGYVMDTHTAVASAVYHDYKEKTGDQTKTVIASTASPYKFATSVMTAIDNKYEGMDDFALIDELSKTSGTTIPKAIHIIF